jgi:tRNA(Arg) A34 adenosine deaminase TadA
MEKAIMLAKSASLNNEVPVGAVIYDEEKKIIIGSGCNGVEKRKNVTLHAEIIALNEASKRIGSKYLSNSVIYVTLEPCSMCLTALSFARIKKIYYGAIDNKFGAVEGGCNLFSMMPSLYKPECYGGVLEEESTLLMRSFFQTLRSK